MPVSDLDLALGLLNTWDEYEAEPELLRGPESLPRLLQRAGYEAASAHVTPADVEWTRVLRERLRQAWTATDEEDAVSALNGVLLDADSRPRLVRAGDGGWAFAFGPPPEDPSFLAAVTAAALLDAVREHGWERFGVCDASPCRCVYLDRTH